MPWSDSLTFPITLRDGRALNTLRDAADLFLGFSQMALEQDWNGYAVELLIAAVKSGRAGDIEDATWQVQRALSRERMP
ncbi:MAG: hypothetical protein WDN29_16480 [Methylovirgula sp.]